jgi:hypothetical protein
METEKITTSIQISKEAHKWLRIYAAMREMTSMGEAVEDLIAIKRQDDLLMKELLEDEENAV